MLPQSAKLGLALATVTATGILLVSSSSSSAPSLAGPVARPAAPAPAQTVAPSVGAITSITPGMARPAAQRKVVPKLVPQFEAAETLVVSRVPARPVTTANSCNPAHLKLRWPLDGQPGKVWATNNYTDLDAGSTKRDFKGQVGDAAQNYNKHRGYDIDVGSFRQMDQETVLARAAAPGKVIDVEGSKFDRNTSCTGEWNFVAIQHMNGFVTYYGHLKKNSLKVKVNDIVQAGTPLGVVGSSGCSTNPHLHFEVHDCNNTWLEPANVQGMWLTAPQSLEQSGALELILTDGEATAAQIKDPPPDIAAIRKGGTLGIGIVVAARAGDSVLVGAFGAGNFVSDDWQIEGRYGVKRGRWSVTLPSGPGTVQVGVWVNGTLSAIKTVQVLPI